MVVYSEESFIYFMGKIKNGLLGKYTYTENNGCISWMEIPNI